MIKKKGEEKRMKDYMEVTITPSLYKVYTLLAGRLTEEMEEKEIIPQNQTLGGVR